MKAPQYECIKYGQDVHGPLLAAEGGMLELARIEMAEKCVYSAPSTMFTTMTWHYVRCRSLKAAKKETNAWKKKNSRDLEKDVRLPHCAMPC